MNFLKKGIEYNFLARALGNAFVAINSFETKFNGGYNNDFHEFKQDLLILAYLCKTHILKPMEEYGWAWGNSISIPKITRGKITLLFAYQQTIGKLLRYAERINVEKEIQEVLDGKFNYEIMRKLTPEDLKFQSALIGKVLMRFRYKLIVCTFLKEGEIANETHDFIAVRTRNLILKLKLNDGELTVNLNSYDMISGLHKKEWSFPENVGENEILLKILNLKIN